jgi:hypothetical protein
MYGAPIDSVFIARRTLKYHPTRKTKIPLFDTAQDYVVSSGYLGEHNVRLNSRRHWCARDSSIESHPKWNLTHIKGIKATGGLAILPASNVGRKHDPTDLRAECKPPSRMYCASIQFHFKPPLSTE